jgi:hypothetical protein
LVPRGTQVVPIEAEKRHKGPMASIGDIIGLNWIPW